MAASQGKVIHVVAERIFRSRKFSALANELAAMINTVVVATTLVEVAADYPDLGKIKYRYEAIAREELLRDYAEVLLKQTGAFPVVEVLASSSTPSLLMFSEPS